MAILGTDTVTRVVAGLRGTLKSKLIAICLLAGSIVGWQAPAIAGSDASSDTYAGDYAAGSLPTGTFLFLQYAGFAHSNAFFDTTGNQLPNSHANTWEEFDRFVYFADLGGHPFVIEGEIPFANLTNVNVPGLSNQVGEGFADPVVHLTYFFISDAKIQRWLGFTNYFYLPLGNYDNTKQINIATDHQFTDVPQIGYTEGLGKFAPSLKGFFFDFVANASIHTDGHDPAVFANTPSLVGPGVLSYGTLTQQTSYDVKAFLRYDPMPLGFVALGIEKSWGGEQVLTSGTFAPVLIPGLVTSAPNQAISEDDYLRGHLQFQFPLARDFAVAADIFSDFQREGGFKDEYGAEIRLTKFFFPAPAPSGPMYTK
jgi:Putative MetA-pathway of phenol degradation